jgi:surfeit locus 1 family protein
MNDLAQYNWRKVLIRGRFLPLSEPNQPSAILIGPRVYEGEGGYHLILPFLRSPSPTASPSDPLPKPILINLGFVTEAAGKAGPNAIHIPAGEVEIEGMMRTEGSGVIAQTKKGKKPTFWTPDNEPEERNWYWMDVAGFAEYYSTEAVGDVLPVLCDSVYGMPSPFRSRFPFPFFTLALSPSVPPWLIHWRIADGLFLLMIDGDNPREALTARGIPVGRPAKIEIRNQHGVYILTWFSIAAATSFLWWKVFKLGRRPKARYGRMGR